MYETMSEAIAGFEEMLDEGQELVMGRWTAAEIMREMDPIKYREEFHNWLDAQSIEIDWLKDDEDLP